MGDKEAPAAAPQPPVVRRLFRWLQKAPDCASVASTDSKTKRLTGSRVDRSNSLGSLKPSSVHPDAPKDEAPLGGNSSGESPAGAPPGEGATASSGAAARENPASKVLRAGSLNIAPTAASAKDASAAAAPDSADKEEGEPAGRPDLKPCLAGLSSPPRDAGEEVAAPPPESASRGVPRQSSLQAVRARRHGSPRGARGGAKEAVGSPRSPASPQVQAPAQQQRRLLGGLLRGRRSPSPRRGQTSKKFFSGELAPAEAAEVIVMVVPGIDLPEIRVEDGGEQAGEAGRGKGTDAAALGSNEEHAENPPVEEEREEIEEKEETPEEPFQEDTPKEAEEPVAESDAHDTKAAQEEEAEEEEAETHASDPAEAEGGTASGLESEGQEAQAKIQTGDGLTPESVSLGAPRVGGEEPSQERPLLPEPASEAASVSESAEGAAEFELKDDLQLTGSTWSGTTPEDPSALDTEAEAAAAVADGGEHHGKEAGGEDDSTETPAVESTEASAVVVEITADTAEPTADTAEPIADTAEPLADAADTTADTSEPTADTAETSAEAADPRTDAIIHPTASDACGTVDNTDGSSSRGAEEEAQAADSEVAPVAIPEDPPVGSPAPPESGDPHSAEAALTAAAAGPELPPTDCPPQEEALADAGRAALSPAGGSPKPPAPTSSAASSPVLSPSLPLSPPVKARPASLRHFVQEAMPQAAPTHPNTMAASQGPRRAPTGPVSAERLPWGFISPPARSVALRHTKAGMRGRQQRPERRHGPFLSPSMVPVSKDSSMVVEWLERAEGGTGEEKGEGNVGEHGDEGSSGVEIVEGAIGGEGAQEVQVEAADGPATS